MNRSQPCPPTVNPTYIRYVLYVYTHTAATSTATPVRVPILPALTYRPTPCCIQAVRKTEEEKKATRYKSRVYRYHPGPSFMITNHKAVSAGT